MKPLHRVLCLFLMVASCSLILPAQDSEPSLSDLARQARERKKKAEQSGQSDTQNAPDKQDTNKAEANEVAGLKAADFKANILLTDYRAAVEKWVLLPASERPRQGRLREVTRDKKIYVPFVVTDYPYPVSEKMDLTVHVRFISPSGKILLDSPKFSENVGADPRSPSVIVLNPVMDMSFDDNDAPGTYTVRITITDHVHSTYARAEEKVQLIQENGRGTQPGGKPSR